jgi:hypothetical protein
MTAGAGRYPNIFKTLTPSAGGASAQRPIPSLA